MQGKPSVLQECFRPTVQSRMCTEKEESGMGQMDKMEELRG